MLKGTLRTVRYARSWKAGADVELIETEMQRSGETMGATLVLPSRRRGPLPAWIALGGVSRMGRFHPQLVRFASALASSGAAVLVPAIPEWRNLRLAPGITAPTIRGGIDLLRQRPEVAASKVGLIGFSFGAPQAAIASARPELTDDIAGVVLFGGYLDLERTLCCLLTGEHEWQGVDYSLSPDPYGRWVVASNHLTDIPGCEDATDVAEALRRLAAVGSEQRISAWEPHHDCMIEELRGDLAKRHRPLYDFFASPTTVARPPRDDCEEMAKRLAEACRRADPLLDPADELRRVTVPTRLIHGRGDRLIPFTESLG